MIPSPCQRRHGIGLDACYQGEGTRKPRVALVRSRFVSHVDCPPDHCRGLKPVRGHGAEKGRRRERSARAHADQGRCGYFKRFRCAGRIGPIPFALREVQKTVKKKEVPGRVAGG